MKLYVNMKNKNVRSSIVITTFINVSIISRPRSINHYFIKKKLYQNIRYVKNTIQILYIIITHAFQEILFSSQLSIHNISFDKAREVPKKGTVANPK